MVLPFLALLCSGCATYEFEVKQPSVPQPLVTADRETNLSLDPLQYQLIADKGHLVMFIDNPTASVVDLLGEKSAVIDPDGVSHPLQDETIQAGSSIKEIFPPPVDQTESPTSNWLVSPSAPIVGPTDASGYIRPMGYGNQPTDAQSDQSIYHWSWDGQSDVEMTLVFSKSGQEFEHHFLIHRRRK
jgi:hypothetical protein